MHSYQIDKASNRQILEKKKSSKSSRAFMEIVRKSSQKINTEIKKKKIIVKHFNKSEQ